MMIIVILTIEQPLNFGGNRGDMKYIYFLFCSLLFGCASYQMNSKGDQEIIYQKKNTSVIDVYNLTKLWFSNEDFEYLRNRNYKYGEFGGDIKICSNEEYYCLSGGIGVAIPKKIIGQTVWQFAGENCKSETPLSYENPTIITCRSKGWENKFVYTFDRGITSYVIAAQPEFEHVLVDEKGLFANPSEKNQ